MGYTHYWYRELEINPATFRRIATDFGKIVLALDDAGVKLADWEGKGIPEISEEVISFNGLENCGHTPNSEIVIPWPTKDAGGIKHSMVSEAGRWFAGTLLSARTCNGHCDYESFVFPRVTEKKQWYEPKADGLQFECCKTAFRPYDLGVTAFLIIAKHHLGDKLRVSSDGEDQHWEEGRNICQAFLGYGERYHLTRDAKGDGETLEGE